MSVQALTFEEYQEAEGISNTGLGKLAKSPAHFKAWLTSSTEEESDALRLGRVAHKAILEPDEFQEIYQRHYVVKPSDMKFSTTAGKEWKAEQLGLDKTIITTAEDEFLKGAIKAISEHPTASLMLSNGSAEVSLFGDYNGIKTKGRIDWLSTINKAVVDVKTAKDASFYGFRKAIADRAYHRQAAWYLDLCKSAGIEVEHFCFIALEKEPPYAVACYQLDEASIDLGRREYRHLLGKYKECLDRGEWPAYPTELQYITLPDWKMNQAA